MRLEPTPVLGSLRELWSMPRGMERFQEYLRRLQDGPEGGLLASLVAANPMAKPHMLAYLDALVGFDAEGVMAEACREAERRLAHVALDLRASLVPVDDVAGAWSERTLVDFDARFPDKLAKRGTTAKYPYASALVYASETPTAALVRERMLAAAYRAAHVRRHGAALTLRDMMRREGRALRFAGVRGAPAEEPEEARAALMPHLDAAEHPTRFAAMYGDAAARRVGHRPLGAPPNAGFVVALDDALRERETAESLA